MSKSILAALKLIQKPEAKSSDPIIERRNRLLERLEEQKALALCFIEGKPFVGPDKQKKVVNKATGETTTETVQKRVKAWFTGNADNLLLEVRYGNVPMELSPGKTVIEIGKVAKLVPTIETVIEAVKAGEVDELLKAIKKPAKL
ncbi:hypothetical protein H3H36_23280 [Duganella sp. FT3S]|uniref:Uncharacterized protein n=1 Tax=Rugamonas fusca TaxID=2758568 RepID=A0A7W2EM14_9BURK|nr:DUF6641 family protein [Rugamonas fusca]MBA5608276.1 hypothetical protein [Rugamonas fusca]